MGWVTRWRKRLRALVRKEAVERELDEEVSFHLAMEAEKYRRAGMSVDEARRRAAIAFGGVDAHKEEVRDARVLSWVPRMSLDFTLGFRMLAKYPGLAVVGGFAIAFAIWVGATGFEVLTRYFYPKLPFDDGHRVVAIRQRDVVTGRMQIPTFADLAAWRGQLSLIEELGGLRTFHRNLISSDGGAEPVAVMEVSASAFRLAAMAPLLGRILLASDEEPGAPAVVLLGHDSWRRYFAGDSQVVGRSIRLGQTFHTVVGVMPEGFHFPRGQPLWVPLRADALRFASGPGSQVQVFGRVPRGVTPEKVQVELAGIGRRAARDWPATHAKLEPRLEPFSRSHLDLQDEAPAVMATVNGFILLLLFLTCGNVALLTFARASAREGELTVRHALGASRRRIIRQLFIEALVLSGVAAAIGLVAADLGLRWQLGLIEALQREEGQPAFWDRNGLAPLTAFYAVLLTVLAAVIAGVVPALKVTRDLGQGLRQAGTGGRFRFGGVWTAVVVAQVAAMVALPVVAFILRGEAFREAEFGVPAHEFLSVPLGLDREGGANAGVTYRLLEARLEAEPQVLGVTFTDGQSLMSRGLRRLELDGELPGGARLVRTAAVATDYLELMDAPILLGRGFHAGDTAPNARTVIVNQSFVDSVLGGRNPIGRRIRYVAPSSHDGVETPPDPANEIVGVVRDIGNPIGGSWPDRSGVYHPLAPDGTGPMYLAVRVRGDAIPFVPRLRSFAAGVDPLLRLHDAVRLDKEEAYDVYILQLAFWLITVVSGGAMLLSLAGIYSVLSFTVAQRRREIGIRLALGGGAGKVATTVARRPLAQVGLGVLLGAGLTAYVVYMMNEGFSAAGPLRILAYVVVMIGVCLLATIVPARQALRVQAAEAMKADG